MYIKVTPGRAVRDPVLKDLIPEQGREVSDSLYWTRRINDGDVVVSKPPVIKSELVRSDAS